MFVQYVATMALTSHHMTNTDVRHLQFVQAAALSLDMMIGEDRITNCVRIGFRLA